MGERFSPRYYGNNFYKSVFLYLKTFLLFDYEIIEFNIDDQFSI